ncbi:hypothetical protein AYI69_g9553 [Smittium culicis]|uniref:Uncharacterized protein n=1 Tax=Smittium culicis TaxID=133412 RepID=A0A1R1XBV7_9FUNG|nr:hypothetical protein AYI69_g9553 [Smittium culicis]
MQNHTPWYDHRKSGYGLESSNDKDPRPTKGTSDFSGAPTGKINFSPTAGAEEPILVEVRVMDINVIPIRRSNTESTVLERPFEEVEWCVVPAVNPREQIRGYTPDQLQGAACSSICLATERNLGPVSSDLLKKYDHPRISERLWEHCMKTNTRPQSHVFPVSSEPSGCSDPLNCTDRVVNFEQEILSIGQEIREARRGPLSIRDQQDARTRCDTTGRVGRTRTAAHPGI